MLDHQGKHEEAEQLLRRTLRLREDELSREHPDTLGSMESLASVLDHQGKFEEAERLLRETLRLRERIQGRKHPDTVGSIRSLELVLDHQGKSEEAMDMRIRLLSSELFRRLAASSRIW